MRFRSLACGSADERARWFDGTDGNAWWFYVTFDVRDGNARRFHATFDGTDADAARPDARVDDANADAARSNDEFTLEPPTLGRPRFRSG